MQAHLAACNFFSSFCSRALDCAESHAARQANVLATRVWKNPLLRDFLSVPPGPCCASSSFWSELCDWALRSEDILKSFVLELEETVKVREAATTSQRPNESIDELCCCYGNRSFVPHDLKVD